MIRQALKYAHKEGIKSIEKLGIAPKVIIKTLPAVF